ncbi:MAG: hypothetical protein ACKVP0_00030 [Pirellulaceae bacterium]
MAQTVRNTLLAIGLVMQLQCASAAQNANDVIRDLEQAFLPAKTIRLKLKVVGYRKGGIYQKETQVASLDAEVMRDDYKWWIKGKNSNLRFQKGEKKERFSKFEYVVREDHLANVSWSGNKSESAPSSFTATFENVALRNEPGVHTLLHAYLLFGFSPNHGRELIDVAREANNEGKLKVSFYGSETKVDLRDDKGLLSIWLSGDSGALRPMKTEIIKGPSDILSGKKLATIAGGGENPDGKMQSFEQHIGSIKLDRRGTLESYEVKSVMRYEPGGNVEERFVIRVLESHTPSKAELQQFVISAPIADGTPVNIREMRHIPHEWRDGRIQKVLDISAAERMSDIRFRQPVAPIFTLSRVILGISLALGIAAFCWLFVKKMRANQ